MTGTSEASLADVLPSAAALLGAPGHLDTLGLAERVGADVRRVVVVLVDGLGHGLLAHAAPHAPILAAALGEELGSLSRLRSPFPSTTPTSLVTLATGAAPGEHGVVGFTVNVPGTERVLTHILWGDDPPPDQWQPVPTVYERLATAGLPTVVVQDARLAGGGLTRAAYRGARYAGLGPDDDQAARVLAELDDARLVFSYTPVIDTAAHRFGIASGEWAAAAAQVNGLLAALVDGLPADTALLVTADHGGLDVPAATRVDIAADEHLRAGLRVLAGEPRVRYLHPVRGAIDDVAATWRERLGELADVVLREDAITRGWFGPVAADHLARIGEVIVVCRGTTVVLATDREPPELAQLVGFHGARSEVETAVPLWCVRGTGQPRSR